MKHNTDLVIVSVQLPTLCTKQLLATKAYMVVKWCKTQSDVWELIYSYGIGFSWGVYITYERYVLIVHTVAVETTEKVT